MVTRVPVLDPRTQRIYEVHVHTREKRWKGEAIAMNDGTSEPAMVPWTICGGVERRLGSVPVVRAGWRWEGPEQSHRFTTGFGAQGPEGSIEFGALIPVGPDEPTLGSTTWMFSMHLVAPSLEEPTL